MKKLVFTLATAAALAACTKPTATTAVGDAAAGPAATTSSTTSTASALVQKALSFVTGSPFEGDITMNVTEGSKPPQTIVYMVKGKKMRFDAPARGPAGDGYVIFDADTKKMVTVTDSKKMAFEMDMNAMPQMRGAPMAGAAMNAAAATKPNVDKTGKEDTVAGYSCEIWKITEGNGDKSEVCIAKGIAFPMMGRQSHAWVGELGGEYFPLRVTTSDSSGTQKSKMEVTKIEKTTIDDSKFIVPAGYKTMNMGDMMKNLGAMQGMGRPPH